MFHRTSLMVLLLLVPGTAASAAERGGFLIGFTVGGGALNCAECESADAGAFGFHLGGSVSPRLSLAADFFGAVHEEAQQSHYSFQTTLLLQYWFSSRFWVGGGPGFAQDEVEVGDLSDSDPARFAVAVQAGVEVWQRGKFAMDLRGRYGTTFTDPETSHVVVLAGFTWY